MVAAAATLTIVRPGLGPGVLKFMPGPVPGGIVDPDRFLNVPFHRRRSSPILVAVINAEYLLCVRKAKMNRYHDEY